MNKAKSDIFEMVVQVIQDVTGLDHDDVFPDATLDEDLGIDTVATLPSIMREINTHLEIKLPLSNPSFVAELRSKVNNGGTVEELVEFLEDSQF